MDTYLTFGQKLENPSTVQCKRRPREYTRGGLNSGVATGLGFKKESGDSPLWFRFIVAEVLCL